MFGLPSYPIEVVIQTAVALLILAGTVLCVVFIVWGGFMMILSGGKEEKIKPAVNNIRHAVIGLIVMYIVVFVAPILMGLLGLPFAKVLSPAALFNRVKTLSSQIFDQSAGVYGEPTINSSDDVMDPSFTNL